MPIAVGSTTPRLESEVSHSSVGVCTLTKHKHTHVSHYRRHCTLAMQLLLLEPQPA
jgi:hypothetical protein